MSIEVEGLSKTFSGRPAVDDITFTVGPGRVTGFLGPNGAGKTTTMRMILDLVHPTSGRATVLGRPYRDLDDPGRLVGAYSLGMKQRLGIAAALLGSPRVLVLDEPANGLDPSGMRWLRGFLRGLAADGRTVFVSSHLLDEIAHVAHEVIVINQGRLITHSNVEKLLRRSSSRSRVHTPQPERLRDALTAKSIEASLVAHDELVVGASSEEIGQAALDAGIPITGLKEDEQRLEDVFLALTGQA